MFVIIYRQVYVSPKLPYKSLHLVYINVCVPRIQIFNILYIQGIYVFVTLSVEYVPFYMYTCCHLRIRLSRNAISAYDTKQKYLEIYSRFVPFLLYLDYLTASTSALVVVGGVVVADGLMVDWRWCLMVEGVKVPWFWLLIQWDPLLASYTLSTNIWHAIIIFIINY